MSPPDEKRPMVDDGAPDDESRIGIPRAGDRVSIFEKERKQLKRRLELQELVYSFSSQMRSERDPEKIAQVLSDAVAELTPFRNSFLMLLDEDERTIRGIVASGHKRTFEIGIRLSKYSVRHINVDYTTIPGYKKAMDTGDIVIHRNKEDIVNTLATLTGLNPGIMEIIRRTTRLNMGITVPLYVGQPGSDMVPLGFIAISSIKNIVDEEAVQVVRILSNQASMALFNAKLFDRLQRQAERAEASEARFRRIMDTAHDMIISYSAEGHVKFANNAIRESRIYSMEGELIDANTLDRIHGEDQAKVVEAYLALHENRPIRSIEYRVREPEGFWLTHNLNATIVQDEQGEVSEIVCFIRDVTLERQKERQMVRRNMELEILNSLITNLTSDIEYDEMITRSMSIIAEFTGADMITFISLTEPIPGKMNVINHLWVPEEFERFLSADLPMMPETQMFSTHEVQVLSDMAQIPDRYKKHLTTMGIETIFSLPVMLRGEAVGYVVGGVKGPLSLDDESLAILYAVGDQLGMVLEITKIMERVE